MKVSIIVPCYNVGNFVLPLLQSLEMQDYDNFEAILVNDGSKDNTSEILHRFCDGERKNDRRKYIVIDKPNGGVSTARNAGLEAATGDLIFFVDGDDRLYPQSISKLAELMKEGIDVAVGKFVNFNGDVLSFPHINSLDRWLRATMTKGGLTLVNKMYRRDIIEKHHLRFDVKIRKSEDHLFTAEYLSCITGGVAVTDSPVYLYQLNPTGVSNISTTTGVFSPWTSDSIFVACRIYKLMEDKFSKATLRELRYDTYHKYGRVRHEAHMLNCKDKAFYDGIYAQLRTIMPAWEIAVFAVRRRLSIIGSSLLRKIKKLFVKHNA